MTSKEKLHEEIEKGNGISDSLREIVGSLARSYLGSTLPENEKIDACLESTSEIFDAMEYLRLAMVYLEKAENSVSIFEK